MRSFAGVPDPSRLALYRPGRVRPALSGLAGHDLGRPDRPPTPGQAHLLAVAAHLAYHQPSAQQETWQSLGWSGLQVVSRQGLAVSVIGDTRHRIVAFRGTDPSQAGNLRTDCDARWQTMATGRIHRGFAEALDQLWSALSAILGPSDHCHFTGHSLGGALAILAGWRWQGSRQAVVFGCPRIGDAQAVTAIDQALPVWRYENCCDAVPHLPPRWAGWRHAGQRLFLDDRGRLGLDPSYLARRRAALLGTLRYAAYLPWARRRTVLVRQLADHAIVNYGHLLACCDQDR